MKLLLAAAFYIFSNIASAQTFRSNSPKIMSQSEILQKFRKIEIGTDNLTRGFQNNLALGSNHIIYLPQDQMPCVVPDTKDIAAIRNAWNRVTVPFRPLYQPIPNPALPPFSFRYDATQGWAPKTK